MPPHEAFKTFGWRHSRLGRYCNLYRDGPATAPPQNVPNPADAVRPIGDSFTEAGPII